MSRKYNTKHISRGQSKYPQRLRKRGVSSASVRMESLETLQKRQTVYGVTAHDVDVESLRNIQRSWNNDR